MFTRLALALGSTLPIASRYTPLQCKDTTLRALCQDPYTPFKHSFKHTVIIEDASIVDTGCPLRWTRRSRIGAPARRTSLRYLYYSQFHERSKLRLSACERQPQSVQSYPYGHVQ